MQSTYADIDQVKERMRATWTAGDFGQVAVYAVRAAEEFVARLPIRPGAQVLDVACGTGNLALPAARAGARVTAVDIVPALLDQGRRRAASENLDIVFDEGDVEDLPYPSGRFDVVMTMFGAMFAPRPERATAELARVCRPGGMIAMGNWARQGFIGKMLAATAPFVPPPPGIPSPLLWGDDNIVRERLASITSEVRTVRDIVTLEYPFPPQDVVRFYREYYGPTRMAFSKLDEQDQARLSAALEQLWHEHNEAAGERTQVRAEYLEVMALRA